MVKPGHIFVTQAPMVVHTVLGSSVATCLWDQERRWGGINHFNRPACPRGEPTTARYGNVAVPALVIMLLSRGSRPDDLVAQILGGATSPNSTNEKLGAENIRIARKALGRAGIRVVSEDVGGTMGRKLAFDTRSGEIAVLKVHRLRRSDWQETERVS